MMIRPPRRWTESEEALLRSRWREKTDAELAAALGRSEGAVCTHRHLLHLYRSTDRPKPMGVRPWSVEEDETLAACFHGGASDEEAAVALGRTEQAVAQRRSSLSLHRGPQPKVGRNNAWTDAADNVLGYMFHRGWSDEQIARRMSDDERTYTVGAIRCRRQTLGLWREPRKP